MVRSTKKTMGKRITRNQKRLEQSTYAFDGSNAIGKHIEPPLENNDVGNANNSIADTAMQVDGNPETAMEIDRTIEDIDANQISKKKTRGSTKVKRLPLDVASRIEVEFNSSGEPIGKWSVKLSSYLGPLVHEHVPFTFEDWRQLGEELKSVLWESVQARFKLDEEWQKVPILRQMGCIWRCSKSKLVDKLLKAKTTEERLRLKPDNVKTMKEWKRFVESRTSNEFKSKTNSMETNCKLYDWGGSKELVAEGRVYSSDPNQIINGIPLEPDAKIVWVDNPKKEDAFLWRPIVGMTCIGEAIGKKIAWPESTVVVETVNASTCPAPMINAPTSLMSANFSANTKCKLIDLEGTGKIVAEGTVSSTDPNALVHSVPLGPNAIRVWVDVVKFPNAPLWRPTSFMECLSDAIGSTVAWPVANVRMGSTSV